MNWSDKLDDYGRMVLETMGFNPDRLDLVSNPIVMGLYTGQLLEELNEQDWFDPKRCRMALSKVATVCQMIVYDEAGGPDGDGKPKGLRRQWYHWYKTGFAQPLSEQLGDKEFKDSQWSGRLSETYAHFVDELDVTYKDLWVDDSSRMMQRLHHRLFMGCKIILAVEKDSLYADFEAVAKAIGVASIISGKGKNSKAATEKMLREHFDWSEDYTNFTEHRPLIVLHISDHDFDGEAVIGPTFGEQARRYTPYVLEARIGIRPDDVDCQDWDRKWYTLKTKDRGYIKWAEANGLFAASCSYCKYEFFAQSTLVECPECGRRTILSVKLSTTDGTPGALTPHGFEVEAMPTRSYYALVVDALLRVLSFSYIVKQLRRDCIANPWVACQTIADEIVAENEAYQDLMGRITALERVKERFANSIREQFAEYGKGHESDWEDQDPDPLPKDFRMYAHDADVYSGPWRPFKTSDRTASLVKWLSDQYSSEIAELKETKIQQEGE